MVEAHAYYTFLGSMIQHSWDILTTDGGQNKITCYFSVFLQSFMSCAPDFTRRHLLFNEMFTTSLVAAASV